jgi:hypothetical protein
VKRQAEAERGRRERPLPPEWIVELGIGTGRPPVQVHAGNCHMAGKRRRARAATRPAACSPPACAPAPTAPRHAAEHPRLTHPPPAPGSLRVAVEQPCHTARYPAERAMCTNRLEQDDLPDDHSPTPDLGPRPLRPRSARRQGRPLRRLPAQDPQVRPRRQPPLSVVRSPRTRAVGTWRTPHQHPRLAIRRNPPSAGPLCPPVATGCRIAPVC